MRALAKTFYRRTLPSPPCIPFSSPDGKRLFRESLSAGNMECYFLLAEQFRTQDDPAFCGLSSLVMVLNSLMIDPARIWKGPWRYFHETMLDCCLPIDVVKTSGLPLGKLACLARCNGAQTVVHHASDFTVEDFRDAVKQITSATYHGGAPDDSHFKAMVCAYSRQVLGQTGTGHFSPIGGYHEVSDHVLILDVARFKYPPHWVPVPLLYEAMNTIDPDSGKARGFMIVERKHLVDSMFHIRPASYEQWQSLGGWLRAMSECFCIMKLTSRREESTGLRINCVKQEGKSCTSLLHSDMDVKQALLHVVDTMPLQAADLLYVRFLDNARMPPSKMSCDSEVGCDSTSPKAEETLTNQQRLTELLQQLEELPLYVLLGELGVPLDVVEILNHDDTEGAVAAAEDDQPTVYMTQRHILAIAVLSALQLASNNSPRARELFTRSPLIESRKDCASMAVAQWLKGEVGGDSPRAPLKQEIESLSKQILELAREYDTAAAIVPPLSAVADEAISVA